jgi:hypothetical protein
MVPAISFAKIRGDTSGPGMRWSMGEPFAKELAALADTYKWAREVARDPLVEFIGEAYARPLLAVGSGGSATAAQLAALLHRFHFPAELPTVGERTIYAKDSRV